MLYIQVSRPSDCKGDTSTSECRGVAFGHPQCFQGVPVGVVPSSESTDYICVKGDGVAGVSEELGHRAIFDEFGPAGSVDPVPSVLVRLGRSHLLW